MDYGRVSNKARERIYQEAWTTSMRQLAKEYGISDVALRKRLSKLDIPFPGRGYWAKSEQTRKAMPVPPLPAVTRTTPQCIFGYSIEHVDIDRAESKSILLRFLANRPSYSNEELGLSTDDKPRRSTSGWHSDSE